MVFLFSVLSTGLIFPNTSNSLNSTSVVDLQIQITSTKGKKFSWTLRCTPVGGNHPRAKSVCNFLKTKANRAAFVRTSGDTCLQIYGGDAIARIRGVSYGEKINLELNRSNSCSINQWEKLITILRYR